MDSPLCCRAAIAALSFFLAISPSASAQDGSGKPQDAPIPADGAEVKTTESGLQYSVLTAGDGKGSPGMGDRVKVHYTGWLQSDGTEFDSSRRRGEPTEFRLGQVIAGWNEGLALMSRGARFKFTIPAELGYGARGAPPQIPANATLIFDVELLDFFVTPKPPTFRPCDATKQKATESGLKYEVLEGKAEGAKGGEKSIYVAHYTIWDTDGQIIDTSVPNDRPLRGGVAQIGAPFLVEALPLMRVGESWLFEVPTALAPRRGDQVAPPFQKTTIWHVSMVEIVEPKDPPPFAMPAEDRLQKTESGLQYEVIRAAPDDAPPAPQIGQNVKVEYAGWLASDGTLFDSSFSRGEPAAFRLGMVIQGWNEGLQLMRPGAIYKFVIPAELGYGARGAPPAIPANAALVFYVELLEVVQ